MAAMGDGELVGFVHFGEGLAKRRVLEDRVVAEPRAAAGLARDDALDGAASFEHDPPPLDDGQGAHEARDARRGRAGVQPRLDRRKALLVGGVRRQEARRVHTRLTVERVDDQARVLGHREQRAGHLAAGDRGNGDGAIVVLGLETCVGFEGGAGLDRFGHGRAVAERQEIDAGIAQQVPNFPRLARIGGGDEQRDGQRRGPTCWRDAARRVRAAGR